MKKFTFNLIPVYVTGEYKEDLVKPVLNKYGRKVSKLTLLNEIDPDFKRVIESVKDIEFDGFKIEVEYTNSLFPFDKKYQVLLADFLRISIGQSYLKFVIYDNKVYLNSLFVDRRLRNNGVGTRLVEIMEDLISRELGYLPKCELICTGDLNFEIFNLSDQTKFFRKFGYRVDKTRSINNTYYTMVKSRTNLSNSGLSNVA